MQLWKLWFAAVKGLRAACSRQRTFFWMTVFLMAVSTRCGDLSGVTSVIRILGLFPMCYDRLLDFLHSPALNLITLTQLWTSWVLEHFVNKLKVNGRIVLLMDGIKVGKEGKKMPAVKALHQESESNSKAEFIMGHSCQALGLLVCVLGSFFCVPLICQIHEGIVFSNRDKRTLYDKLLAMLNQLGICMPYYVVADAYYTVAKIIKGIKANGNHLITRAKKNIVAYDPATQTNKHKKGRRKKYGEKIKLRSLFKEKTLFQSAASPIYGDKNINIEFYSIKLLWRACGELMQFVLVKHPNRGSIILATTDIDCDPLTVIELYSLRFKIEVSFKQSLHTIGAFAYHFWMKIMTPTKRGSGDQHLHHETQDYREQVKRKMAAYHRFIQLSFIAQGLLQYLSITAHDLIWKNFGSWLRTVRADIPPSEMVTSVALRNCLPTFLASTVDEPTFKKFLGKRIDLSRAEGSRLVN